MSTLRSLWSLLPMLLSWSVAVSAGVVVDQEFVANARGARQVYLDTYLGQTFTANRTGVLKRIQIDISADIGLRTDLKGTLINHRSGEQRTLTIPFWKVPRYSHRSLPGIDVSSLGFNVSVGDTCTIVFHNEVPWGTRPTVSLLSGCWLPEGIRLCSEAEALHYSGGSAVMGVSVSSLSALDDDAAFRTYVSGSAEPSGAPVLHEQPDDIDTRVGDSVWIPAFAVGAEPITYRWFNNGALITAGTVPELTIVSAATNNSGAYHVIASNSFGSSTSRVSRVVVHGAPIVAGPEKLLRTVGSSFDISVEAYGKGPLRYEWLFAGKSVGSSSTYRVAAATTGDSGVYTVKVSDDNGATQMDILVLVRDDRFRVKWSVDTGLEFPSSPTVVGGKIYVSGRYRMAEFKSTGELTAWSGTAWDGRNAPIVVGEIGMLDSGRDLLIARFDGSVTESHYFENLATTVAVLTNGISFILETTNNFRAFDLVVGKTLWSRSIKTPWSTTGFAPVYDSKFGVVYVNSENNRIWAFDGATGEQLWNYWLDSFAHNDPCIGADGAFYVGSITNIYCFEPRSGQIRWKKEFGGPIGHGMSVTFDGKLYASPWPKTMAINAHTGEEIWSVEFKEAGFHSPTLLADQTILYWSGWELLTVRDARDGKFLWDYVAPGMLTGPPAVGPDGTIYFTCYDSKLYALDTHAPLLDGPWSRTRGGSMNNAVSDSRTPVALAPIITGQPKTQAVGEGARVTLEITATGTPPLSIQWMKGETALTGQTAPTLTIESFATGDAGEYWTVVTNSVGRVESSRARLTLVPNIPAQVTTVAGSGLEGRFDSTTPLSAKFTRPSGGTVSKDGVIFVGDAGNHVIRYILPNGAVGTWAGTAASGGYREDVGTNSLFRLPVGLTTDAVGDLLVADFGNHRVRKVLGLGYRSSSLLAGDGTAGLQEGVRGTARLNGPSDLVALNGRIYFTEFFNHTVRCINSTGLVTVLAGNGVAGYRDGEGVQALFNGPAGITAFNGDLYVAERFNHRIRKVTTSGVVSTVAGSGAQGFKDGLRTAAELGAPNGIVGDGAGNFYFTELLNHAVRRLDTNGWVSTLAGTGAAGFADGDRTEAKFNRPMGICMHPDGSLIVMDTDNHRVRGIVIDGKTNGWTRSEGFLTADLYPMLKVFGNVGERYRIESRDRLGQGDWAAVTSIVLEVSPTIWIDERADGGMLRVYRAVKE